MEKSDPVELANESPSEETSLPTKSRILDWKKLPIIIPIIAVLGVVLLFAAAVIRRAGDSLPALNAGSLAATYLSLGAVLTIAGVVFVYISFYRKELSTTKPVKTLETIGTDPVNKRPYFGLIHPIDRPTKLSIDFEEVEKREVEVQIQDLITSIGTDHYVTTYGTAHGVSGSLNVDLTPGKYDIYFYSIDTTARKIKVTQRLTSPHFPFRNWREIGLTLVTVGTFFLFEASLKIFG